MSDMILSSWEDRVATLVLNRPEARNALSPELIELFIEKFRAADNDPQIKCIVIRGAGENFSGGGDVKNFNETLKLSSEERYSIYERKLLYGVRLPNLLLQARTPVIVETRGAVAGAGLALCLAADFVISGESSFFLAAHVHIGLCLDSGLSGLLVGAMGIKAAKRMALLGERVDVAQALALGIVTEAVPDDQLAETTTKLAERLASGPGTAISSTKALLNRACYQGFDEQLVEEAKQVGRCAATDDFVTGIRSVLERKPAVFD